MPKVYAIDGITPVVHPSAVLIGDVIVGPRAYIGPRASLRGDFGRIPARVLRALSDEELRWKEDNMRLYQQLALRSQASLREAEALSEPEPQRGRIDIPGHSRYRS